MIKLKIAFDETTYLPINTNEYTEYIKNKENECKHFRNYLELNGNEKRIPVIFGYFGNTKGQDEEIYEIEEIFEYIKENNFKFVGYSKGKLKFNNIEIPAVAHQDASPIGIYFNEKYLPLLEDYYDEIEFDNSRE